MVIVWRIICENCGWRDERDDVTKVDAKAIAYAHVSKHHGDEDEYEFRLQRIVFGKDKKIYAEEDAGGASSHRPGKAVPPPRGRASRKEP